MAPLFERPRLEVADILRRHGAAYRLTHKPSLAQLKVIRHIEECRTAALGGHVDKCDSCGYTRISYNSCRDRHCPKCQSLKKAEWLQQRLSRLLPVAYFHNVFTLPGQLNPLVLGNKRLLYDLLFAAASQTLKAIAADPKHLGAQIAFSAVLHTWGQNLSDHPHLHCVVSGGGLDKSGQHWINARPNFFLPVKVLGKLFRGKFLAGLQKARCENKLNFAGSTAELAQTHAWREYMNGLYQTDWVVYSKAPFGGAEQVFRYLGRYTHRVAISNQRLIKLENGRITFQVKDYADENRKKELTLDAVEFIRRFLLHVLPKGFTRIRHYGLFAGANVHSRLETARRILGGQTKQTPVDQTNQEPRLSWWQRLLKLTGIDVMACPHCKTGRLTRHLLECDSPTIWELAVPIWDSS